MPCRCRNAIVAVPSTAVLLGGECEAHPQSLSSGVIAVLHRYCWAGR
jgi:hypothetical protein